MPSAAELRKIARARLKDAQVLYKNNRFDGAWYLCGYCVETMLKARICSALHWKDYQVGKDFQSFKTHNLDTLLTLSGREQKIKSAHMADWSGVAQWDPEARYKPIGSVTKAEAQLLIRRTEALLAVV